MTILSGIENEHQVPVDKWHIGNTHHEADLKSPVRASPNLTIRLEQIERGLTNRARQKTGYAWRLIVEHMYRGHANDLTFANIAGVMAECAQSIQRLSYSLKDT
jgi:hypothetical protein